MSRGSKVLPHSAALFLMGVCGLAAPSPSAPLQTFTLEQALDYARTHQPSLRVAQARVQARESEAQVARAGRYPRLGISAQALEGTANNTSASYIASPVLDIPRIGATQATSDGTWLPKASTLVGIGVREELFDFGRISAQAAASDFLAVAEENRAQADWMTIGLLVKQSFFAVQAAKAVLQSAQGAYLRAKVHREMAEAGVRSGLRPPIELTRARADEARFEVARERAVGGLQVAQSLLAASLGSTELAVDAVDELPKFPDPPPIDRALKESEQREPTVREGQARLQAQQELTRFLGAAVLPDFSLSGTLSSRAGGTSPTNGVVPPGSGWIPSIPNWDVLVVFTWPLFEPTLRAQRLTSRYQESVFASGLDLVRQDARTFIQRTYVEYELAAATIPALEIAVDSASANEAQAVARFKTGLGTSVELADAESLLTDAEIALVVGKHEKLQARARLGRAISEEP